MNRSVAVLRLYLARRFEAFALPAALAVGVVAAMILVVAAIRLAGVDTQSAAFAEGMSNNGAMAYTLLGRLIALGAQAATSCFAFALAMGVTRVHYVIGTAFYFIIQAAVITVVLALLRAVELATNYWFIGARTLDIRMLGGSDWGHFVIIVFLGALASLALGALFGSSWLRFGMRGPLIIGCVLVLALAVALYFMIPRYVEIVAAITFAWVPSSLLLVAVVGFAGAAGFLRKASVRGR